MNQIAPYTKYVLFFIRHFAPLDIVQMISLAQVSPANFSVFLFIFGTPQRQLIFDLQVDFTLPTLSDLELQSALLLEQKIQNIFPIKYLLLNGLRQLYPTQYISINNKINSGQNKHQTNIHCKLGESQLQIFEKPEVAKQATINIQSNPTKPKFGMKKIGAFGANKIDER
ncbi:hypothetical protein SS50377_22027 [Spironucleus salmonicida]|uniref:Uncharacterized protein n=1 Tax=Spironucleus salmonicida TaxID=348837 RepID=V6LNJ1_9EUKA|nr:hypothetical protein SS50377_22027 [Spironucleus salmonicida]|eukprot:EST45808.1 Hypothetical protein SS50377_14382 [Spironucleus salmonicida]